MNNLRTYGIPPYHVAVVHGGPGAAGEMTPVARTLSSARGVLEPLQTENTLEGQIQELSSLLSDSAELPVVLIGYSWGAWLSIFAAIQNPGLVRKLILISCSAFEEKYVSDLTKKRLKRLNPEERQEFEITVQALSNCSQDQADENLARLGVLTAKTDAFCPIPDPPQALLSGMIFQGVWDAAAQMRRDGELLECIQSVHCPVVAIHGDYDPTPAEGVWKPLSEYLDDFRFVLLKQCGHSPWNETYAKDAFYQLLDEELRL